MPALSAASLAELEGVGDEVAPLAVGPDERDPGAAAADVCELAFGAAAVGGGEGTDLLGELVRALAGPLVGARPGCRLRLLVCLLGVCHEQGMLPIGNQRRKGSTATATNSSDT